MRTARALRADAPSGSRRNAGGRASSARRGARSAPRVSLCEKYAPCSSRAGPGGSSSSANSCMRHGGELGALDLSCSCMANVSLSHTVAHQPVAGGRSRTASPRQTEPAAAAATGVRGRVPLEEGRCVESLSNDNDYNEVRRVPKRLSGLPGIVLSSFAAALPRRWTSKVRFWPSIGGRPLVAKGAGTERRSSESWPGSPIPTRSSSG